MTHGLDRSAILRLFTLLSDRLEKQGTRADVFLVGGAAMVVAYDARRATRDLDAAFAPSDAVRTAAAQVAGDEGLSDDWLNDAVKGFLPGEDPQAEIFFESPHLRVDVASPRYLLAMKLMSARPGTDFDDIKLLYARLGFTTVEEGLEVVERAYPASRILPKTRYLLGELVEQMNTQTEGESS